MKKRNPLVVFILSIITLGIYDIYWLVKTKKVLNEKTSHHTPTIFLLFVPLIIIIVGYVLLFALGTNTSSSGSYNSTNFNTYGTPSTTHAHASSLLIPLAVIVIGFILEFFISIIWFYKFSKAINEYTDGKMSTAVSFLILWIIHLIGVALIQDSFNSMTEGLASNPQPAMAAVPSNNQPQQSSYPPIVTSPESATPMPTQENTQTPIENQQNQDTPPYTPPTDNNNQV